jgi:cytochrome c oxidase cbb3-type subunit 2
MIKFAAADGWTQASGDPGVDSAGLLERYKKANVRSFAGGVGGKPSEADALIAYLQSLGTEVDFKLYDDKANVR